MDFITHLSKTKSNYDSIFVVVDCLSKCIHFIPTTATVTASEVAQLFFTNIFQHHDLLQVIISDCDTKFISCFWQELFRLLGTHTAMSTAHHPQTDSQTKRANRTFED